MSRRKFWLLAALAVAIVSAPAVLYVIYGPAAKQLVLLAFAAILALVVVGGCTLAMKSAMREQQTFEASLQGLPKNEADRKRQERAQKQQLAAQVAVMTSIIAASNSSSC